MFAGIFSCTPSFSPEINKVYLILSYLITQQSRDEMSERLQAKPFILLISDGTQDQAFMEKEIVFLLNAKADRVTVDFISVEHVGKAEA